MFVIISRLVSQCIVENGLLDLDAIWGGKLAGSKDEASGQKW